MTDDWERPAFDGIPADRRDAVVDVPLTGDDDADRPGRGGDSPATNWRQVVGIALAAGTVLGIAVAAVLVTADDGDEPEAEPSRDEQPAAITTPPTLRPLETLPPPGTVVDVGDGADATTEDEPFSPPPPTEPVVVPSYPAAPDAVLSEVVGYDLTDAVALGGEDVARRADTHVELGFGGFVLDVSIERDAEQDRYRVVLESNGYSEEAIIDAATGISYINPGTRNAVTVQNDDIFAQIGVADIGDYFDRLLRGPLRSETFDPVSARGRGLVTIDGIGDAREFVTYVDGDTAPEWQIYAFGPVDEFAPSDRPEVLEYAVYVGENGQIVQVDGVAMLGNVPQLVQHRMTELDADFRIELPDVQATPTTIPADDEP